MSNNGTDAFSNRNCVPFSSNTALDQSNYRLAGGTMPFMRKYSTICP